MTNSAFVKNVLDQIVPQLQPQDGLDAFIGNALEELSSNYNNASTSQSISFTDPRLRAGYIYQYVAAHARYLARILHLANSAAGGGILIAQDLRVACVGGGPGTDALGVLKYLHERTSPMPQNLHSCVLDRETPWIHEWQVIAQHAGPPVVPSFIPLDVTLAMSVAATQCLANADLITMSYLISAVEKLDVNSCVTNFVQACFNVAKPGALLVYVDNSGTHTAFFDGIAGSMGWTLITSWDWNPDEAKWGSFNEDITALEGYKARFGRSFKIASRLSYRVYRKPI